MFVTLNQFYVFLSCLSFGGASGVIFFIFWLVKYKIKNKIIRAVIDVLTSLIVTVLYVFYSFYMQFPSFRAYMILGVILGIYLYVKSFHIILAILCKKIYNILKKNKEKKIDVGKFAGKN